MAMIDTSPEAQHVGADDLPFVDIGGGNKMKVLQVHPKEGLWIVENVFQLGKYWSISASSSASVSFGMEPEHRTGGVIPAR